MAENVKQLQSIADKARKLARRRAGDDQSERVEYVLGVFRADLVNPWLDGAGRRAWPRAIVGLASNLEPGEEILTLCGEPQLGVTALTPTRIVAQSAAVNLTDVRGITVKGFFTKLMAELDFGEVVSFPAGTNTWTPEPHTRSVSTDDFAVACRRRIALLRNTGDAAADTSAASTVAFGVADELRKLAELRDEGVLDEAEFAAQKARLLEANPPPPPGEASGQ